jgi:hypothetical protein
MCADNTDENTKDHPKYKWYDHRPSGFTKAIAGLVVYGLFIFIDVKEFWPLSHIFASASGIVATIALVYLEALVPGAISFRSFLICCLIIVAAGASIYALMPASLPDETDIHGWLLPAREANPVNACEEKPRPKDAILFVFGTNGAWTTGNGNSTVLEVGNCTLMSMQRDGGQLSFDADVFDTAGELIARIEKNEFQLVPGKFSYQRRSEDRSTITVYDKQGGLLLSIRYLNAGVVKVNGTFVCSDMTKVIVTDTAATLPELKSTISNSCKGGFSGKNAGFKFTRNSFAF